MSEKPKTVAQYLAALPKDRRDALQALRKVIVANMDKSYKEGMQYGMPSWFVPHSVYPAGYHCDPSQPLPCMGMASQKNHMSLYLFCIYTSQAEQRRFREDWTKTGKKLDMGKSCVRFKTIDDLPLGLIGKTIKRMTAKKFIASYEAAFGDAARAKTAKKKKTTKKKTTTGKTTNKVARKKTATKPVARKSAATKKKTTSRRTTKVRAR